MVSKVAAFADADAGPSSRPEPVISVENIVHRYESRTALNGVSFDVRPAELFGLLGSERQRENNPLPNSFHLDDSYGWPRRHHGMRRGTGAGAIAAANWSGVSSAERRP